jgi:hypothetical protein
VEATRGSSLQSAAIELSQVPDITRRAATYKSLTGSEHRLCAYCPSVAPLEAIGRAPASRPRRIGVIGRIDPEKGRGGLYSGRTLARRKFPDCTFFLAGTPSFSNNEYFDGVVKASEGLPIHFMGWRNDIADVFSNLTYWSSLLRR